MKLEYLNALKGIAILGVILVHSPILFEGISPYIQFATQPGKLGCQLFFLLSGYLMVYSWTRAYNPDNFFNSYLIFIKKRFVSIAPIYILAVLFYQLFSLFVTKIVGVEFFYNIVHDPISIILNVLILNGIDCKNFNSVVPGGWFIGTIMLFYFLFPFINMLYNFFHKKFGVIVLYWLPIIACIISFFIQAYIAYKYNTWDFSRRGTFLYYSILNQLPCMLVGVSLAYGDKYSYLNRLSLTTYIIKIGILFLTVVFVYFYFRNNGFISVFFPLLVSYTFFFLFCAFKYYFFKLPTFLAKSLLKWGKISYAAYFSNFLGTMMIGWFFSLMFKELNPNIYYFVLLLPMFIITYYIASPIDKMLDWFSFKLNK